jgi:hypothetical protein
VVPQRAELDVAGVEGDRVVTAEDHGDRPGAGDGLDGGRQRGQSRLDVPEYISTSPASTTRRSVRPSVGRAGLGRDRPSTPPLIIGERQCGTPTR